jgi:hypothetical protein
MGGKRREPRWVTPFLRALERTGEAQSAAEDAGIDHSTAYARRRSHAGFATAWEAALKAHAEAKRRAEEAELQSFTRSPPHPDPLPLKGARENLDGEELTGAGGQMKQVGADFWGAPFSLVL